MLKINYAVPRDRPLICMGYKYNVCKFLSFISSEDTYITKADIPYLYNYPDPFSSVVICPVALPLVMYK